MSFFEMVKRRRGFRWTVGTLIAAAATLLLASCATTYGPLGPRGGYKGFQESKTQYYVYFYSNGNTSRSTAYRFFLTRAAQIALKRGYKYFYVYHLKHSAGSTVYMTPGMARTYTYRSVMPGFSGEEGFLNLGVYGRSVTVFTPPTYRRVEAPGYRGQILLVKRRLKKQPPPFDARILYRDGMRLNARIKNENRHAAVAAGVGTAIVIGAITAAAFFEGGGTISFGGVTY